MLEASTVTVEVADPLLRLPQMVAFAEGTLIMHELDVDAQVTRAPARIVNPAGQSMKFEVKV